LQHFCTILAEVLLWCFAPKLASEIREKLQKDKTLRSHVAQQEVLGFPLIDLQKALCTAWHLPELLNALMDDANAHLPRVQNVTLAVNLARHSPTTGTMPHCPMILPQSSSSCILIGKRY
jgi:hypothetical protein